jgi:hypothetical protein
MFFFAGGEVPFDNVPFFAGGVEGFAGLGGDGTGNREAVSAGMKDGGWGM